jgi:hypothetical protein
MNSTERNPSFQWSLEFSHRQSKRLRIVDFFLTNLGRRIPSPWLHGEFGSGFRSRVADINADKTSPITICNGHYFDAQLRQEVSVYWAELRARHLDLG